MRDGLVLHWDFFQLKEGRQRTTGFLEQTKQAMKCIYWILSMVYDQKSFQLIH